MAADLHVEGVRVEGACQQPRVVDAGAASTAHADERASDVGAGAGERLRGKLSAMRSLSSLRLTELVLHKVPAASVRDEVPPPVRLSNATIQMDEPQRLYFQQRLRADLAKDAREVVENTEHQQDVPTWVRAYLEEEDDDLVALSQRLAIKLREVQTGASSDGLVLVASAEWNGQRALMVAKVELVRGVRAEPEEHDGVVNFTVSLLDDLVFGETSRVFKVGVFSNEDLADDRLLGWAIDRQKAGPELAGFFLHEYLGCEYAARPNVITKQYFEEAETWINNLDDDEKKAEYEVALLADMQSGRSEVKPRLFARDHIREEDRSDFLAALSPTLNRQGFAKDTSMVPIKRMKVATAKGVTVLSAPDLVGRTDDSVVQVEQARVTIRDEVIDVGGHGRERRHLASEADEQ